MAFSVVEGNSKHILPKECYQSSDSEEESFVVLGKSIPLESIVHLSDDENPIKSNVIRESLEFTKNTLSSLNLNESLPKEDKEVLPSIPNSSENHAVHTETMNSFVTASSVELSSEEIQQKVDALTEENVKLKEALNQTNLAMKKKCDTIVNWHEDVLKVHELHKQKFAETKDYIEKLKVENAKLEGELQGYKEECEKLKDEIKRLHENLNKKDEKQRVELLKSSFENVKQFELETVQKKVASLEAQLANLQKENEDLKNSLSEQTVMEKEKIDLEKKLTDANTEIEKLKRDIDFQMRNQAVAVHKLVEENRALKEEVNKKGGTGNMKEAYTKIMEQLTSAQMVITNLEQQRNNDLEVINSKQEEIQRLNNELKEMMSDTDIIMALRTQLDVYKADFDAERNQKNDLRAEKEQLSEDLQHLQRRNQQLLEEVERLRKGDFVLLENEGRSSGSSFSSENESGPYKYICPKCSFKFRDLRALENHVDRCIDLDGFP